MYQMLKIIVDYLQYLAATLYHVWKYLNSLPAFAEVISQLAMMSVLEHCMYGNNGQLQAKQCSKAFFGSPTELLLQTFCLKDILWMQDITVHCPIDYNQKFAAIDQVCCKKI